MLTRRIIVLLAGVAVVTFVGGQERVVSPPIDGTRSTKKAGDEVRFLQTPDDAVRLALVDALTLPHHARPYTRYLWIQDGDTRSLRTSSLALNYISRASAVYRPMPVADGHLVRVDLRLWAPRDTDLDEWIRFWEELSFDPCFALLITRDTVDFADKALLASLPRREERRVRTVTKTLTRKVRKQVQEKDVDGRLLYWAKDGKYDKSRPVMIEAVVDEPYEVTEEVDEGTVVLPLLGKGVDVLRLNAHHIDPDAFVALQLLLSTAAPVVDHRYFKMRVLSTIKVANVNGKEEDTIFRTIFGGLYYEFRGVKKAKAVLGKDTKATDLDLYFEKLGVGSIKAGLNQEQVFNDLRSDQRVAMFRSGVTGKPREVSMFHVLSEREGGSWGAITGDIGDENVDIGDRPYANLLNPRRKAREAIFPGPNSFHIFALFNGEGALQDEVPFNIAVDSTIPRPHTQRLQGAIGCIRCHGTDGSDGWKPLRNDVKRMVKKVDLFDDLSDPNLKRRHSNSDVVDRLAGLYAGDFSKNLRRARDDLAEATLRATGPWKGSEDQLDVVKLAATQLAEEYNGYWYDGIDAHQALKEIGLLVPAKDAASTFERLLPPDVRVDLGLGFVPEDPRVAALKDDVAINRADFALAQAFIAERAATRIKQLSRDKRR